MVVFLQGESIQSNLFITYLNYCAVILCLTSSTLQYNNATLMLETLKSQFFNQFMEF